MEPYELSICDALLAMDKKELSSVELTKSCLARIAELDADFQAFITVDEKGAQQQAADADALRRQGRAGKLCGVPISIKDLLCTKGIKTTCGSKMLESFIPPYDATVVAKLKKEGAVILGKVAMDEFAMGSTSETCAFGVPQNPYKKGYVAGGSSGGSAASVALMECAASLGSDTGGSIRQPASLCGVVGIKPTYGRVSRYGLTAFASSLDQVGPLARNVQDCSLMLEVISGHDPRDSTSVNQPVPDYCAALKEDLSGLRVGVPKEYFAAGVDPETAQIVTQAIKLFAECGATVVDVSLPRTEYCVAAYYLIAPSEASSNLARYDGAHYGYREEDTENLLTMYKKSRSAAFGDEVKRRILIGTYALSSGYYDAYYKKASQVRTLLLEDYQRAFTQCDLLVSPVCPTPAWPIGAKADDPLALYMSDILTLSANLAGVPGVSVPGGYTTAGLPVGVQLQGGHFQEATLLRAAYALEQKLALEKRPLDIAAPA